MIAQNKSPDQVCRQLLARFFKQFPHIHLKSDTNRVLKMILAQQIPMLGKPGGWAGGIIYAVANQGRRPCGVPALLNKECERFFNVSMSTIYKRAWRIRRFLIIRSLIT